MAGILRPGREQVMSASLTPKKKGQAFFRAKAHFSCSATWGLEVPTS